MKRLVSLVCAGWMVLACTGGPPENPPAAQDGGADAPPPSSAACLKDQSPEQRQATLEAWLAGTIPPDVGGTEDCNFEDFAWQSFLALTQDTGDGYLFTHWGNSQDLFPATGEPPPFPGTSGLVKAHQLRKIAAGALALSDPPVVEDTGGDATIQQAATFVPLVDQRGRWVHYSVYTNQTEYEFVRTQGLYASDCYARWGGDAVDAVKYCLDSQNVFVDCTGQTNCPGTGAPACATGAASSPLPKMPTGGVELKLGWQVLETCDLPDSPDNCTPDDQTQFIVAPGEVAPYSPTVPGPTKVTLGLVGMHIVHKTPDHPDWVWATFEHRRNDPDCSSPTGDDWLFYGQDERLNMFCSPCPFDYKAEWPESFQKKVEAQLTANPPQAVVDGDGNLLCTAKPSDFNLATPHFYNPGTGPGQCAGAPIPTQVCRSSAIPSDVQTLNGYVQGVLGSARPVLANYQLVGALWLDADCSKEDCTQQGDSHLSNTTMETYLQAINCLVCHGKNQFNPNPYPLKPYAAGIADRSFVFQRILEAQLPEGVECTAPKASYDCPACPKSSAAATAGGR